MEKRMGASLGFLAFAVATLSGVMVGNPLGTIVGRALAALFAFYVLGRLLGWLAERVLAEREEALCQDLAKDAAASPDPVEEAAGLRQAASPTESAGQEEGVAVAEASPAAKG